MAYTQFLEEAQRRAREEEKPTNTTTISLGTDVEADDEFDYENGESEYGSSHQTSSASLFASIYKGVVENGRRYQGLKEEGYFTPSDEKQFESIEKHHLVHRAIDSQEENDLFRSPLGPDAKHVLDIGCGTGAWCVDVADRFPDLIVHGVDLYPPVTTWVPENCHLEVDDISKPWTWPHKFDLIHIRFMLGSLTEDEWTTVYSEAYKYLNPGGWIEHIDCGEGFNCDDGSVPPHAAIWQWGKWMEESGHRSGKPMDIIRNMRQSIENAGFVNVHQKDKKSPQGRWPKNRMLKDVGELQNQAVLAGCEGYSMYLFTKFLGWSTEEVKAYLVQIQKELVDPRYHNYSLFRRVWAQKPYETSEEGQVEKVV